jgi:hypothetical protein
MNEGSASEVKTSLTRLIVPMRPCLLRKFDLESARIPDLRLGKENTAASTILIDFPSGKLQIRSTKLSTSAQSGSVWCVRFPGFSVFQS